MCLASAVVLCPVLLRGHPSLIPPTRCLSIPLLLSFSQWLFLLSSQLPAAFSWARSVCTKSQPGHRVPLSSKPSFWYWCLLPAVLGCDRHSPALDPWCIPQTLTHVSPLSLTRGGSYFSGRSTAPPGSPAVSLTAQRKSELCTVVEDHGMCPSYRRIRMQCLL